MECIRCSVVQCQTVQCDGQTVQNSAVKCQTVQNSAKPNSTEQCSAMANISLLTPSRPPGHAKPVTTDLGHAVPCPVFTGHYTFYIVHQNTVQILGSKPVPQQRLKCYKKYI